MMNPLIYRGICANGRAGKLFLSLALVSIVFLVGWLFLHLKWQDQIDEGLIGGGWESYRLVVLGPLGFVVLALQYAVGFLLVPINSGDTLPTERLRKSEEFFTTLPISAPSKTAGLLIGPNVLYLLLMAVFAVPVTLLLLAGQVELGRIIWSQVLLWTGSVSFSLLAILLGHSAKNKTMSWGAVLLLLGVGLVMLSGADWEDFSAMPALAYAPIQLATRCFAIPRSSGSAFIAGQYHFFGWSVPWQLGPMAVHGLVGLSCFAASSQRLRRPSSPPLPRWGTLLVFAGLHLIAVGFLADFWRDLAGDHPIGSSAQTEVMLYSGGWFVFLLLWSVSRCPSMQSTMEWMSKRASWPARLVSESLTDPRVPGYISLGTGWALTFLAIWTINALYLKNLLAMGYALWIMAIWGMFLIAYYSVVLICSLTMRRGGIFVGGVAVLLLLVVPAIFSSAPDLGDSALVVTPAAPGLEIPLHNHLHHADRLNGQLLEVTLASMVMAVGGLSGVAMVLVGLARRSPRLREGASPA